MNNIHYAPSIQSRFKFLFLLVLSLSTSSAVAGNLFSNPHATIRESIEEYVIVDVPEGAREKQLPSQIISVPSEIQNLILSFSSPNQCVSRRHRRMVIAKQKSLKMPPHLSIQTQLKTYLGTNDRGLLENIDLSYTDATDEDLHWITLRFPNLISLDLRGTYITDTGLGHITGMSYLTSLNLRNWDITEAEFAYAAGPDVQTRLAGLSHLTSLSLRSTQVTDAGLAQLARLKHLTSLDLEDTRVTDAGLRQLPIRLR